MLHNKIDIADEGRQSMDPRAGRGSAVPGRAARVGEVECGCPHHVTVVRNWGQNRQEVQIEVTLSP